MDTSSVCSQVSHHPFGSKSSAPGNTATPPISITPGETSICSSLGESNNLDGAFHLAVSPHSPPLFIVPKDEVEQCRIFQSAHICSHSCDDSFIELSDSMKSPSEGRTPRLRCGIVLSPQSTSLSTAHKRQYPLRPVCLEVHMIRCLKHQPGNTIVVDVISSRRNSSLISAISEITSEEEALAECARCGVL